MKQQQLFKYRHKQTGVRLARIKLDLLLPEAFVANVLAFESEQGVDMPNTHKAVKLVLSNHLRNNGLSMPWVSEDLDQEEIDEHEELRQQALTILENLK